MIDFCKLHVTHSNPQVLIDTFGLIENNDNVYHSKNYLEGGQGFSLRLQGNSLETKGSFHQLYHGNNYTDFTYPELAKAVNKLKSDLILPDDCQLRGFIEVGINIEDEHEVYTSSLYYKNRYTFHDMHHHGRTLNGKIASLGNSKTGNLQLKFYNKTKQYTQQYQTDTISQLTRFEIRFRKSWFQKYAVDRFDYIDDLTTKLNYVSYCDALQEAMLNITYNQTNSIDLTKLDDKERHLLFACSNPEYCKQMKYTRPKVYSRDMAKYKRLVEIAPKHEFDKVKCFLGNFEAKIRRLSSTILDK